MPPMWLGRFSFMLVLKDTVNRRDEMNSLSKILLVLILLAGLSACASSNSINMDAELVSSIAAQIADFDLPNGYNADFSAHLMGYAIASFRADDSSGHLYLIQADNEADGEKLAEMLRQLVPGAYDPQTRMTIIETRPVTIHGQEETLAVSEGVTSEGKSYRQTTVTFQGRGGPALLVISMPAESWDQASVDAFLASIQ
jgi:hypothetical protein